MTEYACPVCDTETVVFDEATVMGSHAATYRRCPRCGLITTHETPWLEAAYSSAIHCADRGLLRRAQRYSAFASAIIGFEGLKGGRFLDWAAGYGVFCQAMRDRGHDFYQHDDFAKPVFATEYVDDGGRYDMITGFEVMEHLADPRKQLADIVSRTDHFLFTTETLPDPPPRVGEWWYYMPNVGQHITFHTAESLRILAGELGFQLTSNGANWHLFHRQPADVRTRAALSPLIIRAGRGVRRTRNSLLRRG